LEDTSGTTAVKIPKTKIIKRKPAILIMTIRIAEEEISGLVTVLVVRKTEMQSQDSANVTLAVNAVEMTPVMTIMNPIK
jgi:hypothetical protein